MLFSAHDLDILVARSSKQVLSVNLQGCFNVRTHTIMQALLCNPQLEQVMTVGPAGTDIHSLHGVFKLFAVVQVDLSYCNQVAIHNIEFFLESVLQRPNPMLKQLTIGHGGCRPQVSSRICFRSVLAIMWLARVD